MVQSNTVLAIAGPCRRVRRNGTAYAPTHGRPTPPHTNFRNLAHLVNPVRKKHPNRGRWPRTAPLKRTTNYFHSIFLISPNISAPPNVYMYCRYITSEKEASRQCSHLNTPALLARYPHRLARKRGMPIPQRTPGPLVPRCLGPFSKKQTQSRRSRSIAGTPLYIDSGVVPSECNESRDLPFGWTNMKNKPNPGPGPRGGHLNNQRKEPTHAYTFGTGI